MKSNSQVLTPLHPLTDSRVNTFSIFAVITFLLTSLFLSGQVLAAGTSVNYAQRDDVQAFIDEMVTQHGFDRQELTQQFASAKRLDNVLESISKPAERVLTWKQYRPIFIKEKRIAGGKKFIRENRALLEKAERTYGVPKEIIAAIIGVETYYGKHTGRYTIFDSLTTLSFDYPPRAKFFRSELKAFLQLSREEHISIDEMTGSYAGAMGMPQFISSSYREYAVDFDGDGKRDLWHSLPDVVGSVANYFSVHGWRRGESVVHKAIVRDTSIVPEKNKLKPYVSISTLRDQGTSVADGVPLPDEEMVTLLRFKGKQGDEYWLGLKNFYVITRYNHSALYAMAVHQLSQLIKDDAG